VYGVGQSNTMLTTVNLSYNGLSDDGAVALGRYVRTSQSLRQLDVTNNRISVIGVKPLAAGLKKNANLELLRVRFSILIICKLYATVDTAANLRSASSLLCVGAFVVLTCFSFSWTCILCIFSVFHFCMHCVYE